MFSHLSPLLSQTSIPPPVPDLNRILTTMSLLIWLQGVVQDYLDPFDSCQKRKHTLGLSKKKTCALNTVSHKTCSMSSSDCCSPLALKIVSLRGVGFSHPFCIVLGPQWLPKMLNEPDCQTLAPTSRSSISFHFFPKHGPSPFYATQA